jgi:hypothetical protein
VSSQLRAPDTPPFGEISHRTHWTGDWVGPRAGLDTVEDKM